MTDTSLLSLLPGLIDEARREARRAVERAGQVVTAGTDPLPVTEVHTSPTGAGDEIGTGLLIHADNLDALGALVVGSAGRKPARGRVGFAYLDPPFDSRSDYRSRVALGDGTHVRQHAYADRWHDGTASYLTMLLPRLLLVRELLADDGAVCVHVDWHASHLVRISLDEIFGRGNFVNSLVWSYRSGGASRGGGSVPRKHDDLLVYRASAAFRVNPLTERQYLGKPFIGTKTDAQGRSYVDTILRDVLEGEVNLVLPRGDSDAPELNSAESGVDSDAPGLNSDTSELNSAESGLNSDASGLTSAAPGVDSGKSAVDSAAPAVDSAAPVVDPAESDVRICSVRPVLNVSAERTGYATQKPLGLLEILVRWFSKPGDVVLDAFSGSGTTAIAAARLRRTWIAIDAGERATLVARMRLLDEGVAFRVSAPVRRHEIEIETRDGQIHLRGVAAGARTGVDAADVAGLDAARERDPLVEIALWGLVDERGRWLESSRRDRSGSGLARSLPAITSATRVRVIHVWGEVGETSLTHTSAQPAPFTGGPEHETITALDVDSTR